MKRSNLSLPSGRAGAIPKTARGLATKHALVQASREVFEVAGYFSARVNDIVKAAGVSTGSFYRYFPDKEAVLEELMIAVRADLYESSRGTWDNSDPRASLYAASHGYLTAFVRNRRILTAIYDYLRVSSEANDTWTKQSKRVWDRIERNIASSAARRDDAYLDTEMAAYALSSMVEMVARGMYLDGSLEERAIPATARTIAEIWYRAVFSPSPPCASDAGGGT